MSHTDFTGKFLFQPPTRLKTSSDLTHTAIQMSALSARLALEDRTLVNHKGGRAENVAEHSCMLALVAPVLAEKFYPNLDANLVARFATIHDAVEAYVGDTPTHDIDVAGQLSKDEREKKGLEQLLHDYRGLPSFVRLVSVYEKQQVPEARFVRVVDKLMPLLVHFIEGGETLRGHIDVPGLLENSSQRARMLRDEYPDFEKLIAAREELAELASKHLY
jgi:putative hydrolase of HD superfamily